MFPFSVLENELRKNGFWAVAYAALILPGMTTNRSVIRNPDTNEVAIYGNLLQNLEFIERMRDVIKDVIHYGWI